MSVFCYRSPPLIDLSTHELVVSSTNGFMDSSTGGFMGSSSHRLIDSSTGSRARSRGGVHYGDIEAEYLMQHVQRNVGILGELLRPFCSDENLDYLGLMVDTHV